MLSRRLLAAGGGQSFHPPPEFTASGPYDPGLTVGATVLTQVHCHTNQSDGAYSPAAVVAAYQAAGYGALAITDHDKVTVQPNGITTKINGNELSPTTCHIIGLDTTYTRGGTTDPQGIIDGIVGSGGLAEIAHPKWFRGQSLAQMQALEDYTGFEIHNATCVPGAGQNPVTYPGFAVDRWNDLLNSGYRPFGFAVDDWHSDYAYATYDIGRTHVFVPSNSLANVMASLEAGHFVADVSNHGVTPGYPDRSNDGVSLSCTGATRIEAWGATGLLAADDSSSLDYGYTASDEYVRLVAWGDYTEGFGAALNHLWVAESGTWTVGSGVLNHAGDGTPRHFILRRHREGDFQAQVDVKLNHASGALLFLFNVLLGTYHYGIRIGPNSVTANEDNKLALRRTVNGTANSLANTPYVADPAEWQTIKLDYTAATGRIRAKVWERDNDPEPDWMLDFNDTTWRNGAFGFRATQTPDFDNFYVNGFKTYYQPIRID